MSCSPYHGVQVSAMEPFYSKGYPGFRKHLTHAAHWVCGSRWDPSVFSWTKLSDQCFHQLEWPCLKLCHAYLSKLLVTFAPLCPPIQGNTPSEFFRCNLQLTHSNALFLEIYIWNKIPFNLLLMTDRNTFRRAVKCYFFGSM